MNSYLSELLSRSESVDTSITKEELSKIAKDAFWGFIIPFFCLSFINVIFPASKPSNDTLYERIKNIDFLSELWTSLFSSFLYSLYQLIRRYFAKTIYVLKNYTDVLTNIGNDIKNNITYTVSSSEIVIAGIQQGDFKEVEKSLKEFHPEFTKWNINNRDGALIMIPNILADKYGNYCTAACNNTNNSIYSMSDFGIIETFIVFGREQSSPLEWIKTANKLAYDGNIKEVKRIQVLNESRHEMIKKIANIGSANMLSENDIPKSFYTEYRIANFNSAKTILKNGYDNYIKYYVNGSFTYNDCGKEIEITNNRNISYRWFNTEERTDVFWVNEFIIFDKRYLFRYNEKRNFLEVMLGNIVHQYLTNFETENSGQWTLFKEFNECDSFRSVEETFTVLHR